MSINQSSIGQILPFILFSCVTAPTFGGNISFNLTYEAGSPWTSGANAAGHQASMRLMLDQFAAVMRTSGNFDTTIDVHFNDDENNAFASTTTGSHADVVLDGTTYRAGPAWRKAVLGQSTASNDIIIRWNFSLSSPSSNRGLARHELLHGFGMSGGVSSPELDDDDGDVTKPNVGSTFRRTPHNNQFHDLNDNPLLDNANPRPTLQDYAVEQGETADWGDANGSGLYFRGIDDDGKFLKLPFHRSGTSESQFMDFSHVGHVSFLGSSPLSRPGKKWAVVDEFDRAYLRGLGYSIVIPEPSSLALLGLIGVLCLCRRRGRIFDNNQRKLTTRLSN